jgi:hypothetical protein
MQSHFEVNVSLDGRHFFATAERSLLDEEKARRVFLLLKELFPKSEGYHVSLSGFTCKGLVIEGGE